jgi:hypothetical protein
MALTLPSPLDLLNLRRNHGGGRPEAAQERAPPKGGGAECARWADGAGRSGCSGERKQASLERVPEEGGGEPVESPSTAPRARLVPRLLETRATAAAAAQARRLVHALAVRLLELRASSMANPRAASPTGRDVGRPLIQLPVTRRSHPRAWKKLRTVSCRSRSVYFFPSVGSSFRISNLLCNSHL